MNTTNIEYTNDFNFEMCQSAELSSFIEIAASTSTIAYTINYPQLISIIIASIVAVFSMVYAFICQCLKPKGYKFHFVGIARPQTFQKSQYKLLDNIDAENTLITLQTKLKPMNTVSDLKQVIRETYKIDNDHDILIVYSHHILNDENVGLQSLNITNNALFTLAICAHSDTIIAPEPTPEPVREPTPLPPPPVEYESDSETDSDYPDEVNALFGMYTDYESEPEPVKDVNELFGMFKDYESDDDSEAEEVKTPEPTPPPPTWPRLGFDIITQEDNVLVHKMPKCGHEMNHESLYNLALSTFSDPNNKYIQCPHSFNDHRARNGLCNARWDYNTITDILQYKENPKQQEKKDKWMDYAKLELLASRNVIQDACDVQKCARCSTLYYKNANDQKKPLDEIKTVEDIENEFKFECVLCKPGTEEIIEKVPFEKDEEDNDYVKGQHNEDEIKEDIDGDAVNAMFGNDIDSDYEEDEDEEDEQMEALRNIYHMFDDDDPDFVEESKEKTLNGFCWCCGEEWIDGHICDSSFKRDLVEILQMAEPKTIGSVDGVPSIRCCPLCCQLIFHVDACKHMNCHGCKKNFCFVCLKPRLETGWQCGSHCDKCPVHPPQDMDALPDTIVITKKSFQLYA